MKKYLYFLIFVLSLSYAAAATISNPMTLNATGSNIFVSITDHINLSSVTVGSDSIYFGGVNYSNPAQQTMAGESISFNLTEANVTYTEQDLPYFSASTDMSKTIYSNVAQDLNGSITLNVTTCTIGNIYFNTYGTANDKTYNSGEWTCSNNLVTLNYTNLHSGSSYFYVSADVVASSCPVGSENATVYFSIYDEDDPDTLLNASAEVELNYWVSDTPQYVSNFTVLFENNNTYALCINNNETTLNADLYIRYTTDNGFTHRYILANTTLEVGTPQNLSIYNFNTTTSISDLKITARRNSNYNYYTEVIGKLQRRYTAEGVWRTVQMDKSGDFGLLFFNIREENTDYRLIFTDMQNNVLKTTDTMKFVCSSAICDLTVLLDPYSGAASSDGLTVSYTFNNDTGIIDVTWIDADAGTNTVEFKVRQATVTGYLDLCNITQTGSAGSMTCDLSGRSGAVTVTIVGNGEILINDLLDLSGIKLGSLTGQNEGAVWAVFIIITCVMFGLFSPVGAIIAMLIGLIAIYLLGIFTPITITFVIIASVIGIVIGFKVRE